MHAWKRFIRCTNTRWDTTTKVTIFIQFIAHKSTVGPQANPVLLRHSTLQSRETYAKPPALSFRLSMRTCNWLKSSVSSARSPAYSTSDRFTSERISIPLISQENKAVSIIIVKIKLKKCKSWKPLWCTRMMYPLRHKVGFGCLNGDIGCEMNFYDTTFNEAGARNCMIVGVERSFHIKECGII